MEKGSSNSSLLHNGLTSNNGTTFDDAQYVWELFLNRINLAIIFFSFSVVTVCGNGLVITAVIRERHLHTATNYFVTSLAFADCLVGLVVMPFSAIYEVLEQYWPFDSNLCDFWRSLDVLFSTASILNLCVISIDRYWAISDPFNYPARMTRKLAAILIIVIWFASSLISFPAIIWWRAVRANTLPQNKCLFTINFEYIVVSSTVSFYFPLVVMVFTYYKIYREAVAQTKSLKIGRKKVLKVGGSTRSSITIRLHRGGAGKQRLEQNLAYVCPTTSGSSDNLTATDCEKKRARIFSNKSTIKLPLGQEKNFSLSRKIAKLTKEKKAAKTLGIVMGVFIICWLPFFVTNLLSGVCSDCIWQDDFLLTAVSWLGWINSGLNPFIYACWSKDFRRAFIKILCRRKTGYRGYKTPVHRKTLKRNSSAHHCESFSISYNVAMDKSI